MNYPINIEEIISMICNLILLACKIKIRSELDYFDIFALGGHETPCSNNYVLETLGLVNNLTEMTSEIYCSIHLYQFFHLWHFLKHWIGDNLRYRRFKENCWWWTSFHSFSIIITKTSSKILKIFVTISMPSA